MCKNDVLKQLTDEQVTLVRECLKAGKPLPPELSNILGNPNSNLADLKKLIEGLGPVPTEVLEALKNAPLSDWEKARMLSEHTEHVSPAVLEGLMKKFGEEEGPEP